MAWRVVADGPMIDVLHGTIPLKNGGSREHSTTVIGHAGQIIRGDLTKSLKDRYVANDPYVRSIVEYGELEEGEPDDNGDPTEVFVAKGLDGSDLPSEEGVSTEDLRDVLAKVQEAAGKVEDANKERDAALQKVDELESKLKDAEATPKGITYADLTPEALKAETESRKLEVKRGDGKPGDPLKADHVKALEEDDAAS